MRILSTSACHCAFDSAGWLSTMPAEWQARQLLLAASAPGPSGNMRSPVGRSKTLTDLSEIPVQATRDARQLEVGAAGTRRTVARPRSRSAGAVSLQADLLLPAQSVDDDVGECPWLI
jgi:hypothetical protein